MQTITGRTLAALAAALTLAACGGGGGGGGGGDVTCPSSQVACGAGADLKCVDPLTDREFCGANASCQSYEACGAGEICDGGACKTSCPPGQYACGGKCIDPQTDHTYCGAGATCTGGTNCADDEVCGSGHCAHTCPNGQVICAGKCVTSATDREFCGADTSCQGYTACDPGEVCDGGQCKTSCPNGQYACGGKCIDPQTDHTYCGADAACNGGTPCPTDQVCSGGHCGYTCPVGQQACGGKCIDPQTDENYCGADATCGGGHPCGTGSFCNAGQCWSPCGAGQAFCGETCVDPQTNRGLCNASGLCSGAASGTSCAPDQVCAGGACACPAGQVLCSNGTCQAQCDPALAPGWEWKASVPLTAPPTFKPLPQSTVIAHITFDDLLGMVDDTTKTTWTPVGSPGAITTGVWAPVQWAAGPFTASDYWVADSASGNYLRQATAGPFTVCARYKPGRNPLTGPNKNVVSLGTPEGSRSVTPGGWSIMQMHRVACFHYYSAAAGEWMAPVAWDIGAAELEATDWVWQCGGWDGAGLTSLHDNAFSGGQQRNNNPSTVPLTPGFPATIDPPAIGNYPVGGVNALSDGAVYEVIITGDPATEWSMKNLLARTAGGLRLDGFAPTTITGADGTTYAGSPGLVNVEPDGSVRADQEILLGAWLPVGSNTAGNGQCWGVEASSADWGALPSANLLEWTDGTIKYNVSWGGGAAMCVTNGSSNYICRPRTTTSPGVHYKFQYCLGTDQKIRIYQDGVMLGAASTNALLLANLPSLENTSSRLTLKQFSAGLDIWRVWACVGENPTACP